MSEDTSRLNESITPSCVIGGLWLIFYLVVIFHGVAANRVPPDKSMLPDRIDTVRSERTPFVRAQ